MPDNLDLEQNFERFRTNQMASDEAARYRQILRDNFDLLDDGTKRIITDGHLLDEPPQGQVTQPGLPPNEVFTSSAEGPAATDPGGSAGVTDAMLLIDEPGVAGAPAIPSLPSDTTDPNIFQGRVADRNSVTWEGVPIDPPGTNPVRIPFVAAFPPVFDEPATPQVIDNRPTPPNPLIQQFGGGLPSDTTDPNIFQGRVADRNSVTWEGVPIDPPGTNPVRTVRIVRVRGVAILAGVGVVAAGSGIYIATHHTSTSSTSQGSTVAQGSPTPGSNATPGANISSDPAQAVKDGLILSVTPAVAVRHDIKIVTAADTLITHYLETYSTNPLAVSTTGTLPDGSAVSAVTDAKGKTCSTSFGQTNVSQAQTLTQYNNYNAFGRTFAITAPKFEPDGPVLVVATTTPTYKKIIGNGPPFSNQPAGRTFQVNTIEVFIDPGTGLIVEVVEHAKFTDANGTVTEQTVTYHDYNHQPDVKIPKCP